MEARMVRSNEIIVPAEYSLRTVTAILFRQRPLVFASFLLVVLATITLLALRPDQYEAEIKILVEQEREDPLVTSETSNGARLNAVNTMNEEAINSEVGLLQSTDLLEKVVVATGLDADSRPRYLRFTEAPVEKNILIARAVANLQARLRIDPPRKSHLITVAYRSSDPRSAAQVLSTLGNLYLEKHSAVHRRPGTYEFFKRETERYRQQLDDLNQHLVVFNREAGVVSPDAEKSNVLNAEAQFDATLKQTNASISEIQNRIRALENQLTTTPQRKTTQVRTSSTLLEQLESHLFDLEQQRVDLLNKFEPTYRPVQELDRQIGSTRSAIEEAKNAPIKQETTDGDPTYSWLTADLAKSKADLAAAQARASATQRTLDEYQERAHQLDEKGRTEQDLVRNVKTVEESYLASQRKQEEARLADALDERQIVNVGIAQAAAVPYLPVSIRLPALMLGLFLALMAGIVTGLVADHWDHSFHNPVEVELALQLPVLAALPKNTD
jgi:uncharacterized protein involved in exopolysaccharide biosynthesis